MKNILLLIAVLLAFFAVSAFKARAQTPPAEAKTLVDAGARLIDVRTPGEFSAGHIKGAVNIPLQEMDKRLSEFGPKDGVIVLYCRSGNRSGQAKTKLDQAGFTQTHNAGGMAAWISANGS